MLRASLNDTKSGACVRGDGKDLVWDWMQTQKEMGRSYKFVQDKEQLMSADNDTYILGNKFISLHKTCFVSLSPS